MGRTKVENPFKEQGIPSWIRYLATGLTGFLVAYLIFGGSGESPTEISKPSQIQAESNLRTGIPAKDDDNNNNNNNNDGGGGGGTDQNNDDDNNNDDNNNNNILTDDVVVTAYEFPDLEQDQYLDWVRSYYQNLNFEHHPPPSKLTNELLEDSLQRGCDYMVANQQEAGNFNYQYDFVTQTLDASDSPVRQAGALWGMTLCFQSMPLNSAYRTAVERGILFFQNHLVEGPDRVSQMIAYPGFDESQSGVNALYGLALIDYLRTMWDNDLQEEAEGISLTNLEVRLGQTIRFLRYMQNENLHFAEAYYLDDQEKSQDSSPYYDGETLLCLTKAARYIPGYRALLVPLLEEAVPVVAKAYTLDAWSLEHDSAETKGFYQWSSMVFAEYYFAEWENYEFFGDLCLLLAHWIIHTHTILERQLNTGYAFEGILSALAIARDRESRDVLSDLEYTIDEGLYKLTRWQVGGPLAHTNKFLKKHPTNEKIAIGGIMNAKNKAPLRIDTTQHQMHALMMAKQLLFSDEEAFS